MTAAAFLTVAPIVIPDDPWSIVADPAKTRAAADLIVEGLGDQVAFEAFMAGAVPSSQAAQALELAKPRMRKSRRKRST